MKRIVEKDETVGEDLLGEYVTVWCVCYIYSGKLVGLNTDSLELTETHVVYETGDMSKKQFAAAQLMAGNKQIIRMSAIESWGPRGW